MGTVVLNFFKKRFLANEYAQIFEMIKENNYSKLRNELDRLKNEKLELINFQNQEGVTLLMFAVHIENGASAKIVDKQGKNALFYLINSKASNKLKILKTLTKAGCSINDNDSNSSTCLNEAVKYNDTELVKILLDEEGNVEIFDKHGVSPLHRATDNCNIDILKLILGKKCSVNQTDKNGITALHIAAMHNDLESVKLLINRGGSVNAKDKKMNTPLTFARYSNSKDAFYYLKKFGGKEFKQLK